MKYRVNNYLVGESNFKEKVTINGKGTFGRSSDFFSNSGFWYFGNSNEELDIKNKETIILVIKESSNSSWKGLNNNQTFYIDRLTGKEMILKMEYTYYNSYGNKVEVSELWRYGKE